MRHCISSIVLVLVSCGFAFSQRPDPQPAGSVSAPQQSATPAAASAANPARPVYKAVARTVVLEVVVTDSAGRPINNLTRSDFSLFEDKKLQKVSYFEAHSQSATSPVSSTPPPLPADTYSNIPRDVPADSVNVILLDALNTRLQDQAFVRQQMVKYLRAMHPGNRIAIFTLGTRLRIVQGFTDDPAVLLDAVDGKKHKLQPQIAPWTGGARDGGRDSFGAAGGVRALEQFGSEGGGFQRDLRTRITLQAIEEIGRYLSAIPGRKNLIWFSGSFPLVINPDPGIENPFAAMAQFSDEIHEATNLLAIGQIAVYPVGAQGLVGLPMYDASNPGRPNPAAFNRELQQFNIRTAAEHLTMDQIARETGGVAIYDSNDLKGALSRVIDNGSHYYTLAYTPANSKWDGRFRHIKVDLSRSGYKLQYRQGYFADDPEAPHRHSVPASSDPFIALMNHGMPDFTQIIYKVQVTPAATQPAPGDVKNLKVPSTRYQIDYAALVKTLALAPPPDGFHHGVLRFAAIAYDRDGNPLNSITQDVEVDLKPETFALFQQAGFQFSQQLDIPQGEVYLRTGIFDPVTGKMGAVEIPVTITVATK